MKWNSLLVLSALFVLPPSSSSRAARIPEYWMGSATNEVTPVVGVPLAGYGGVKRRLIPWDFFGRYPYAHFMKPSTEVIDPIRAKALVLAEENRKILFVSLDVVGVETVFVNEIKEHAATLGIQDVFVSATHTHSGPGTLGRNKFYQLLTTDRFQPKIYAKFLAGVKDAITKAAANLEPIVLYHAEFDAVGIQSNRRKHPGVFDPKMTLLYGMNPAGEIVGGFTNFAVHPVVYGQLSLGFSADLAGAIERHLTYSMGSKNPILFINGAEGDVTADVSGPEEMERKSALLASDAAAAMNHATTVPVGIKVRRGIFEMPKGHLHLAQCMELPKLIRGLKIGGKKWFPRNFEMSHLEVGNILMITWPGEPSTTLGEGAKRLAEGHGYAAVLNLGLTNGYHGYFLTESEYAEGGYETCVGYHGPKAGQALLDSHAKLLAGGDSLPPTTPEAEASLLEADSISESEL